MQIFKIKIGTKKKLQEQNLKQIINLQKQNKILKKKLEDGEF